MVVVGVEVVLRGTDSGLKEESMMEEEEEGRMDG